MKGPKMRRFLGLKTRKRTWMRGDATDLVPGLLIRIRDGVTSLPAQAKSSRKLERMSYSVFLYLFQVALCGSLHNLSASYGGARKRDLINVWMSR